MEGDREQTCLKRRKLMRKKAYYDYIKKGLTGYMKLVSWNVNGIRACMGKGFKDFFDEVDADIFALQETKVSEGQIDFKPEGYFDY